LIAELIDPDACQYDHNDLCQTHGCSERPCPQERAKRWLAEYPTTPTTESITVPYLQFCNGDHCSIEERAVIDAALAFHKQRRLIADMPLSEALEHGRESYDIVAVFEETCSALLAARAKEENVQ
jgi:hypothetical protein